MTRMRRVLLIAFAISLLVHLVVAYFLRFTLNPRNDRPEAVSVERTVVTIVRATPRAIARLRPTPHPISAPPPAKRSTQKVRPHPVLSAAPGKGASSGSAGNGPKSGGARPSRPAPSAPPSAVPSPAAGCPRPEASPAVLVPPEPPDIAPQVRAAGAGGIAAIDVKLDSKGSVLAATVSHSTGNGDLDAVAVSMARGATYAPGYVACRAVAGDYIFSVKFIAW
ncbi:MAG TPA: TonB family protein [Candidatus Baltobacteraceae bacterium]